MIYHILNAGEWELALRNAYYSPAAFALDGFIHCCTAEELQYVGDRHFRGQRGLFILCIDTALLIAPIKYEDLNGEGMSFPHIYGALNTNAVKNVIAFPPRSDGTFRIPVEIER